MCFCQGGGGLLLIVIRVGHMKIQKLCAGSLVIPPMVSDLISVCPSTNVQVEGLLSNSANLDIIMILYWLLTLHIYTFSRNILLY